MPDASNILKEYLVSLGFEVDNTSFQRMQRALDALEKKVGDSTGAIAAQYVKASGVVVTALASITAATVTMMDKIAQADLGYQKFALHMYMSRDAAMSMKIATDAMGESLEDIAWMPELRERYMKLQEDQRRMNAESPEDMEKQLKHMRDIRFEFTRLRVESTYGLREIGYNILKNFFGPMTNTENLLHRMNEWLIINMPMWSKKVADFLSIFIQLGGDVVRVAGDIWGMLKRLWEALPPIGREITVLGGIVAISMISPFGRIVTIISGLLLLLDDFYAYIDGRKSSQKLAPIWYALEGALTGVIFLGMSARDVIVGLVESINLLAHGHVVDAFERLKQIGHDLVHEKQTLQQARTEMDAKDSARNQDPQRAGLTKEDVIERDKQITGSSPRASSYNQSTINNDNSVSTSANHYTTNNNTVNHAAMAAAAQVSQKTGIPAQIIYGQWEHETGNFKNRGARELNNFAGLREKSGEYKKFGSMQEFAEFFAAYIPRKYGDAATSARTPEQYAMALKKGGYYEDTYQHYVEGIKHGMKDYDQAAASVNINNTIGEVTVNVPGSTATPAQIAAAVQKGIRDSQNVTIAQILRESAGVF